VSRLVEHLGEPLSIKRCQRKTELAVMSSAVSLSAVEPGDAVIAFSRRAVLQLSAHLQHQGFAVSTLYGALAPEVRRTQAELFSTGQTDIVVATDAIGMGMNLPIRRVLFHAVEKFDGYSMRPLDVTECLQIGGRAGRYGQHAKGYVGAFSAANARFLAEQFTQHPSSDVTKLPVGPSPTYVQQLARRLGVSSLRTVLRHFWEEVHFEHELFEKSVSDNVFELALVVDSLGGALSVESRYNYACAPVAAHKEDEIHFLTQALEAHSAKRVFPLFEEPAWLSNPAKLRRGEYLERAESLTKHLGVYAWLAMKFPLVFCDGAKVPALRRKFAAFVGAALSMQHKPYPRLPG
jgi:ATP-dependent RNA helicase SUPV3L1/SUV3